MKKAGKRILAAGVTLGIICGIGGAAFASDRVSTKINNCTATGRSTISNNEASAYTTYNGSGAASVTAKYETKHVGTNVRKTQNRTKATYGTASVSFKTPSGHLSEWISSTHTVNVSNQKWSGNTYAEFPYKK